MYANDQVDSDVRLNAKLLDVWEADANQDIYILIRLVCSWKNVYIKDLSALRILMNFVWIYLDEKGGVH